MEPVILLVEDSKEDVFLLRQAFRHAGLQSPVQVVRDGVEAMAYLLGQGVFSNRDRYPLPGILLVDPDTSRCNGLELLAWLRTQPDCHRFRTVVLAQTREAETMEWAYRLGAESYLVKPADAKELRELIAVLYKYWVVLNHLPEPAPSWDDLQDAAARATQLSQAFS